MRTGLGWHGGEHFASAGFAEYRHDRQNLPRQFMRLTIKKRVLQNHVTILQHSFSEEKRLACLKQSMLLADP